MQRLIDQIESAFVRKAAYQIVSALERGHSPATTIAISVVIIVAVAMIKNRTTKSGGRHE